MTNLSNIHKTGVLLLMPPITCFCWLQTCKKLTFVRDPNFGWKMPQRWDTANNVCNSGIGMMFFMYSIFYIIFFGGGDFFWCMMHDEWYKMHDTWWMLSCLGMSESNWNKSNRIAFRVDLYKSNRIYHFKLFLLDLNRSK